LPRQWKELIIVRISKHYNHYGGILLLPSTYKIISILSIYTP